MHTPDRFSVDRAAEPGEDYTDDAPTYAYGIPDGIPADDLTAVLVDNGWEVHGADFIPADGDHFTDHTRELIHDCYPWPPHETADYTHPGGSLPVDMSAWPWRHLTLDYAAAAADLAQDYTLVTIDGHDYYAREI